MSQSARFNFGPPFGDFIFPPLDHGYRGIGEAFMISGHNQTIRITYFFVYTLYMNMIYDDMHTCTYTLMDWGEARKQLVTLFGFV